MKFCVYSVLSIHALPESFLHFPAFSLGAYLLYFRIFANTSDHKIIQLLVNSQTSFTSSNLNFSPFPFLFLLIPTPNNLFNNPHVSLIAFANEHTVRQRKASVASYLDGGVEWRVISRLKLRGAVRAARIKSSYPGWLELGLRVVVCYLTWSCCILPYWRPTSLLKCPFRSSSPIDVSPVWRMSIKCKSWRWGRTWWPTIVHVEPYVHWIGLVRSML